MTKYMPLRNDLITARENVRFPWDGAAPGCRRADLTARTRGQSFRTTATRSRGQPQDNGGDNDGVEEPGIRIRPIGDGDRPMLSWLVAELWGSEAVAVHGTVFQPAELAGFIAERSGRLIGLLTYHLAGDVLEIVTLNAIERRAGIGTLLIEAAVDEARRCGGREIRLTTTNDNVDALRFYQRRGFRLAELRPGAVDQTRQQKSEIPTVGSYGIPLRDELDLTLPV
jgi:ribosomal protein S18 acetylase RimI-like enzyme